MQAAAVPGSSRDGMVLYYNEGYGRQPEVSGTSAPAADEATHQVCAGSVSWVLLSSW